MIGHTITRKKRPAGVDPASLAVAARDVILDGDTISAADGALIASWTDSISGLNFTQATTALKPTAVVGAANGHKIARFAIAANGNVSVTSSILQVTSRTLIAVVKNNVADYTVNGAVMGYSDLNWYFGISTAENVLSSHKNTAGTQTSTAGLGTSQLGTSQYRILTAVVSTSGSNVRTQIRLNGVPRQDRTLTTGHAAVTATILRVGNASSTPVGLDLAYLVAFGIAQTNQNVYNCERWLAARFAVK